MTNSNNNKLGIYCRISKLKEGGKDLSIDDQRLKGIALANKLGIDYEVYIDEGISGTIQDRPEFERFLGDVSNGTLTHVYAIDQSRFERNPQIRFIITDLFKKSGITYHTEMDGEVDLNDPQSEFFGDLLSVINKYHVTMTKLKVKSVLKNRVGVGKSRGILPYGYTKDDSGKVVINGVEAEIVKRVFQMSLDGIGTRTIAQTLQAEGIPTKYNKIGKGTLSTKNKYTGEIRVTEKKDIIWSPASVMGMIKQTFYKGDRFYSGDYYNNVPIIIDPEFWHKVNDNLSSNRNNSGKRVEYRYLLKGLLRCGVCGRNMYGHKRENKHDNHYMCSSKRVKGGNCGNRSINIDRIENFIWFNLFLKGELVERIENDFTFDYDQVAQLEGEIEKINKVLQVYGDEKKRAINLTIKGLLSEDDIADTVSDIDKKIKEQRAILDDLTTKMKGVQNSNEVVSKYRNQFERFTATTSFTEKKQIVNDFIKNIVIKYDALSEDYLIDIEYSINIPSDSYVTSRLNKGNTYAMYNEDGSMKEGSYTIPTATHFLDGGTSSDDEVIGSGNNGKRSNGGGGVEFVSPPNVMGNIGGFGRRRELSATRGNFPGT